MAMRQAGLIPDVSNALARERRQRQGERPSKTA